MISQELERLLDVAFGPEQLVIEDDSAKHRGHAGNTGGGHFNVFIVSSAFTGLSLLERHRKIYEAVQMSENNEIHALSIRALSPDEWKEQGGAQK